MKVSGKRLSKVTSAKIPAKVDIQKIKKSGDAKSPAVDDVRVIISERSKEITQAREVVSSLEDVRVEKVIAIKGAIETGNYHVDSKELAKKIVNEALFESIKKKRRDNRKR